MTIDEAIKVAEAVNFGPWDDIPWSSGAVEVVNTVGRVVATTNDESVGAFIAKFDPPTVLALLRFVQAWDEWHTGPGSERNANKRRWDDVLAARAAVDEALG